MTTQRTLPISILICTRNRLDSLRETLATVGTLAIPAGMKVELVVVDNGSTDGTEPFLAQLSIPGVSVRAVREASRGVGNARNAALRAASGEILLFTDDDTRLPADWISALCDPILSGTADAVAGCVTLAPELERPWMRPLHRAMLAGTDLLDLENPQEMFGASMAFSRRILERVPAFDAELGPGTDVGGMEDTLFSWQIKRAGFRIVATTSAVVEHHPDAIRLSRQSYIRGARQYARSLTYIHYHWLHQPPPSLKDSRSPRWMLVRKHGRLLWPRIKRRLRGRKPPAEGIPLWELVAIQHVEEARQYLKERGRPRKYQRRGLVKRSPGSSDDERG